MKPSSGEYDKYKERGDYMPRASKSAHDKLADGDLSVGKAVNKRRYEMEKSLAQNSKLLTNAPDYLTDKQKNLYYYILDNLNKSILSNNDVFLLEQASISLALIHEANEKLNDQGAILETFDSRGNPIQKPNAYVKLYNDQLQNFHKVLIQLGLSPAARSSMSLQADNITSIEDNKFSEKEVEEFFKPRINTKNKFIGEWFSWKN